MKLNEGFLNTMQQALTLLRTRGAAQASEAVRRALRGHSGAMDAMGAMDEAAARNKPPGSLLFPFAGIRARMAAAQTAAAADAATADAAVEEGPGQFGTLTYRNAAGQRHYRLYVPASAGDAPLPLIVMLHGCTQDATDFAAGTQMNVLAEQQGCLVVYPIQPRAANPSKCWNWFKPADQRRESGEPSLIAGITREIMAAHRVDPARVYVAGLSAGGAMAAIMVQAYPELYAAAGVHSGLAAGAAHDLPGALAAMKGGFPRRGSPPANGAADAPLRPVIVFHGDADATVHRSNAAQLVSGFSAHADMPDEIHPPLANRRGYTVARLRARDGADAELWTLHGAPHAWSGGSAQGTYTDPEGPDASAQMLRFFLAHPRRA